VLRAKAKGDTAKQWSTLYQTVYFDTSQYAEQGLRNGWPSVCLSVCPRVCLSVYHSTSAAACGGFAAQRCASGRYQSTAAGAQQQRRRSTALSSKCEQCRVYSWRRKLNTQTRLGSFARACACAPKRKCICATMSARKILDNNKMAAYSMKDVRRLGIEEVVKRAIDHVSPKYVHRYYSLTVHGRRNRSGRPGRCRTCNLTNKNFYVHVMVCQLSWTWNKSWSFFLKNTCRKCVHCD